MEASNIPNLAAVTYELIHEIAWSNPELFVKDGEIQIYTTLYHLGFHIDKKDYLMGVQKVEGVYVRCRNNPDMVYVTTVYAGRVRKAVKSVKDGKISYNKDKWHSMKSIYEKYEILQPTDIYKYVSKEEMVNILEIGTTERYNKK